MKKTDESDEPQEARSEDPEGAGSEEGPSNPAMIKMERVKALMTLSRQMMTQYHERRNLEWRIHVLLWTLLVAGGYFIVNVGLKVNSWWWAILLFTVWIIQVVWTVKMQLGETRDQDQSARYRRAADALLMGETILPSIIQPDEEHSPMPEWLRKTFHGYWFWNVIIFGTTFVMALAIALVSFADKSADASAVTQRMQTIERQLVNLEADRNKTAAELKQLHVDLEVLKQKLLVGSTMKSPSRQVR